MMFTLHHGVTKQPLLRFLTHVHKYPTLAVARNAAISLSLTVNYVVEIGAGGQPIGWVVSGDVRLSNPAGMYAE